MKSWDKNKWIEETRLEIKFSVEEFFRKAGLEMLDMRGWPAGCGMHRFNVLFCHPDRAFAGVALVDAPYASLVATTLCRVLVQTEGELNFSGISGMVNAGKNGNALLYMCMCSAVISSHIALAFGDLKTLVDANSDSPKGLRKRFSDPIDLRHLFIDDHKTRQWARDVWGAKKADAYYDAQVGLKFAHLLDDGQVKEMRAALVAVP